MPNTDDFKALFLPKSKLRDQLAERVRKARADLAAGVQPVNTLAQGDPVRLELLSDAIAIGRAIQQQEQAGTGNPGPAFCAMKPICDDAAAFRQNAPQRVAAQQQAAAQATSNFDSVGKEIGQRLEATRKARALIGNETAANGIAQRMRAVEQQLAALNADARAHPGNMAGYEQDITALRDTADTLLHDANEAKNLPPQDGTARKASQDTMGTVRGIAALSAPLNNQQRDARGRTVEEEAAMRLEVFDTHFAAAETDNPDAKTSNKAMRLAAVVSAMAGRRAKDVNDPHLEGRIGQMMVREYAPELAQSLNAGNEDNEDERKATAKALRIAQALLMDDPVGKALTNKIRPEDAVQRIRDQADIAGLAPSQMMKLLRQQFEMRLGSMSHTELDQGELKQDKDQAFVLSDLQGELNDTKAEQLTEFETRAGRASGKAALTTPAWDGDGLALKGMGPKVHVGAKGETLADLALRYLGDASRAPEIFEDNAAALNKILAATPQGEQPDLSGVRLKVNVEHSLLDEIGRQVAAWDTPPDQVPDEAATRQPKAPTDPDKNVKPGPPPTAEQLQEAATKLKSPQETEREGLPAYIPPPGLGQDHTVRAPLEGVDDPDAQHGALNERQYAHLRMLQRCDQEDKEAFESLNGQSVEDFVIATIAQRHDITEDKARALVAGAAEWFGKVPLTITFTAASLFSDPTKDEPAHGAVYKSEVEYSRTQTSVGDLIGRDDNIKTTKPTAQDGIPAKKVEEEIAQLQDEQNQADQQLAEQQQQQDAEEGNQQGVAKIDAEIQQEAEEQAKRSPKVGVTGGNKGAWMADRGANYMRWRRDKDLREARLDELAYEDQPIFGAVNPNFEQLHGTAAGLAHGSNYYGDAHFLLNDAVRPRSAFSVRGGGVSIGGGKTAVQRTDLLMMFHDMIKGGEANMKYMDAMLLNAKASPTVVMTKLDWEVHLYGGFDIRKDAKEMYLSPNLDDDLKGRIERFAATAGVGVKFYDGPPQGITVINSSPPTKLTVPFD